MNRLNIFVLLGFCTFLVSASEGERALHARAGTATRLAFFDAKKCRVEDIMYMIARMSGRNILVTPDAGKVVTRVYLQNVTDIQAVESVCRMAGLWYREDGGDILRVMTSGEYARDLRVEPEVKTEVITLLYPDVNAVAQQIENLYPDRVELSANNISTSSSSGQFGQRASRSRTVTSGYIDGGRATLGGVTYRIPERDREAAVRVASERVSSLRTITDGISTQPGAGITGADLDREIRGELEELHPMHQKIYITVFASDNKLLVRSADTKAVDDIKEIIEELDKPTPQVLLEVKILDVTLTDKFSSVFDIAGASDNSIGGPNSPVLDSWSASPRQNLGLGNFALESSNLVYQFMDDSIRARIQMLQQDKKVKSVGTPMLLCANNENSDIFVGEERPLLRSYSVTTNTTESGIVSEILVPEVEIERVGTTLSFTPRINADRSITLKITQVVSTLNSGGASIPVAVNGVLQNVSVDTVKETTINATIQIKDKLTVALGGLIREDYYDISEGVPLLKNMPGVGFAFQKQTRNKERVEQILLITPHVMINSEHSQDVTRDEMERLSKNSWFQSSQSPLLTPQQHEQTVNREEQVKETPGKMRRILRFLQIKDNEAVDE